MHWKHIWYMWHSFIHSFILYSSTHLSMYQMCFQHVIFMCKMYEPMFMNELRMIFIIHLWHVKFVINRPILHELSSIFNLNQTFLLVQKLKLAPRALHTSRKPPFYTKMFSIAHHLQLCCNWDLFLWQLSIKLNHPLYSFIVESIFQLGVHLPNIPSINNVSKLNAQLCW